MNHVYCWACCVKDCPKSQLDANNIIYTGRNEFYSVALGQSYEVQARVEVRVPLDTALIRQRTEIVHY